MNKHLILFDADCPFCLRSLHFLVKRDRSARFLLAPLKGETAHQLLKENWEASLKINSILLLENFKTAHSRKWIRGKAVFRILQLLGAPWSILGVFTFLPSWFLDFFYRLIAHHRHRLSRSNACPVFSEEEKKRFL
jgi:predicted DCC family thiol-disulfide oxidoreductase YuxK